MRVERTATILRLSDGRDLAYAEFGDPIGTPVFAFHGTPGSREQLAFGAEAAKGAGVRLIAPDRPGYGASTFQPHRRLIDWPQDVAAIADHLALERFGVVGVSGGGPHAAVCAHSLGSRLLGAVIVSGIGPTDDPRAADGMMPLNKLLSRLGRSSETAVWAPMAALAAAMRAFPETLMKQQLKALPPADQEILARPELRKAFMDDMRNPSRTSSRAAAQDFTLFCRPWGFAFEDIAIPVHLWQGTEDRNVPESHARLQADRIPNAKLHMIEGAGHMLFLDHMAEILEAAVIDAGSASSS